MMSFKVYKKSVKCSDPKSRVQFLAIREHKNTAILGQPGFQFLALRVDENGPILG